MSARKRCPWWKGHDWRTSGYDGLLIMRETCTRCGWHKVFNGALEEAYLLPPDTWTDPA